MWEDPIVQEVRDARAKHAEQFNFDLRAIYEDFKKQEKQSGRKIVSFPPKRIQPIPEKAESQDQEPQIVDPKDDPTIAAIREARHKISASVDHDPYKLLEHYRKRQALNPERIVSLNNEVPSRNKALKLANSEVELSLPPDPEIPQRLEKEVWVDSLFRLFEKERETVLVQERTEMVLDILSHRYGDVVPVDQWQPALTQYTSDQLKVLMDRAWEVDSLEAFGYYLEAKPCDMKPVEVSS